MEHSSCRFRDDFCADVVEEGIERHHIPENQDWDALYSSYRCEM